MEHPDKLASMGTLDTGHRQATLSTKQNTKNSNTAPTNTTKNIDIKISAHDMFME
jgi:hypothetical protein